MRFERQEDTVLNETIEGVFIGFRQTYGTRRIKKQLERIYGLVMSRRRIGLNTRNKRRFRVLTTDSNHNSLGVMTNSDMLPKPFENGIPIMTTGYAQQSVEWIAKNSDGWINFPRPLQKLQETVGQWRKLTAPLGFKPYTQGLMLDLKEEDDAKAFPIHLGFSSGKNHLIDYLNLMKDVGVNHVIFYLKLSKRPAHEVMEQLGKEVLPYI